jgi:hypothetical protein
VRKRPKRDGGQEFWEWEGEIAGMRSRRIGDWPGNCWEESKEYKKEQGNQWDEGIQGNYTFI